MQLPADFITKYTKLMGEDEATDFLTSFNNETNHGFRVNPLKGHQPIQESLDFPVEYSQWGYYGEINGKTSDHQSGAIYSQEPSAMYVGEVVHPKLGENVLDLCAAPGGKTTHLGSFMNNTGLLIANEIDGGRVKVLTENVERFGLTNTIVTNSTPEDIAGKLPDFFDRILVDAPCSGEGMFRKNPEAVKYWNLDYPTECALRQREILTEAVKVIKPGGELIYSTCTFAPEEDEQIVAWLVEKYGFEILPVKKYEGMVAGKPEWANGNKDLEKCVRLFPHKFNGEGHFIAKLKKPVNSDVSTTSTKRKKKNQIKINAQITDPTNEQTKLWQQFKHDYLANINFTKLVVYRDNLYSVPFETPNLTGVKIHRLGLWIGTFKKNRFEPSYALALAIKASEWRLSLNINEINWNHYVSGDTFAVSKDLKKGWYLLVHDFQAVGFGKVVNGVVKNFFPKGLRFNIK